MRRLFLVCLLFVVGYAQAGTVGYTVGHTPSGASATFGETGSVLDAITNRTVGTQVINNAITLSDVIDATVAGNRIALANARAVTLGEVAAATAAVGAAAYAGCAAGTAIANYSGMGNGTNNGSRLSCNLTDWVFDQGQDPSSNTGNGPASFCTNTSQTSCGTSLSALYSDYVRSFCSNTSYQGCNGVLTWMGSDPSYNGRTGTPTASSGFNVTFTYTTCSNGVCSPSTISSSKQVRYYSYCKAGGVLYSDSSWSPYICQGAQVPGTCPASIDALNPAFSTPAGSAPGPDGKCPTGRYSAVTVDDAKRILTLYGTVSHAPDVLKWLIDNKKAVPIADDFHLTGPSSVTGSPSTSVTTNPDGSTVTTTTNPRTDYTYDGNTVNWTVNNTTVVQTCVQAGSCTTTTTTTNETKTECELNPFSAGCGGDPAAAGSLYTKKDRTFQSVLTAGRDAILATPLGSAMGNFFTIASGGSCPVWSWSIPYIKATVTVDEFCSDWAMSAYAVMKTAVLIIFAWVAFRWAVL